MTPETQLIFLIGIIVFCVLYMVPSIIAFARGHRSRWPIFILNFVFGGTVIAWFALIIWSLDKMDMPKKDK